MRAWADLLRVPLLGRVAAGWPIEADAELADTLTLDARLFSSVPNYLLRVEGDSMIEDGILDGDLVGVKRTLEAREGWVVLARLDGVLTSKRLSRAQDAVRLLPCNPAYAPIEERAEQEFAI